MEEQNINAAFDYRALRLLMGVIALSIPFSVSLLSCVTLTSISASCHTEAQDIFIGALFTQAIALVAFGIAWIVTGKYPRLFTGDDEML